MTDIYALHSKSFSRVSAYVVMGLDGMTKVATIGVKFPADGAGRLYAYVHWIGVEMVRGQAGGYGYDKRTAATEDAARKLKFTKSPNLTPLAEQQAFELFRSALQVDNGDEWNRKLEKAGFTVLQAV